MSRLIDADAFKEYIDAQEGRPFIGCTVGEAMKILIDEQPTIQPESQEGEWILHETPDGGEQYECSQCGVLWEFNDGSPEDNEAYFCPKCGAKMKGAAK